MYLTSKGDQGSREMKVPDEGGKQEQETTKKKTHEED